MIKAYDISEIYIGCDYAYIYKDGKYTDVIIHVKYELLDDQRINDIMINTKKYFKNSVEILNTCKMRLTKRCMFKDTDMYIMHISVLEQIEMYGFKEKYVIYDRMINDNHIIMDAKSFIECYAEIKDFIEHSFFKGELMNKKVILHNYCYSFYINNFHNDGLIIDLYFK